MKTRIVFLMYHELELAGRPLCHSDTGYVRYILPASDFQTQMQSLQRAGFYGLSVSDALRFPTAMSGVAITFDDGCESDLVTAAPILRELGFGATFYVTAGSLGSRGYLSVRQLKELSDLGFEVGCHSMTHAYLSDLDGASLDREIVAPKLQMEQILGRAVEHFSCPGGRYNTRVVQTAKGAGYRTLATSRPHANSRSTDPFALGRVAIMRGMNLDVFQSICCGQGLWRMRVMDLTRAMAKQLLGNSVYERMRTVLLGRSHDSRTSGN